MAHDHHHDDDTYFIDQLSMVALAGAFGVICLCLYFLQTQMLVLLLGPQFHLFIAISGFTLVGLALVRAATLWREAKPATPPVPAVHDHHHDHDHEHHHHEGCDHGHCDHGHDDHAHAHDHSHNHAHDHSHDDHDHGWAPWRYVVMLIPIMLFLLGLPNKGPTAAPHKATEAEKLAEQKREVMQAVELIGSSDWERVGWVGAYSGLISFGDAAPFTNASDFSLVLDSANDPGARATVNDRTNDLQTPVKLRGILVPDVRDPRFLQLVRFKIGCCGADAQGYPISVFAREPLNVKPNSWAEVVGKIEYGKRGSASVVRLVTPGPAAVKECVQDPYPYIK